MKVRLIEKTQNSKIESMDIGNMFEQQVLRHRPMAHRLGWHLIRRWGLELSRDEGTSMIDYALCETLARFDQDRGTEVSTYLYYVLKGELKRMRRTNLRAQLHLSINEPEATTREEDAPLSFVRPICPRPLAEQSIHEARLRTVCKRALTKLPSIQRKVLIESVAEGQSVAGLARRLGYSRGHLSSVKSSAMRTIRKQLRNQRQELLWDSEFRMPDSEAA